MKKLIQNRVVAFAIAAGVLSILNLQPSTASAQNTAFYFQDQVDQDSPTDLANGTHKIGNGNYTFVFRLATAASGNNYIGDSVTNDKIVIDHKQFSTPLDFGNVFDGSPRWVEIAQKKGKDFVTLTPRQLLPSTPYALYAYATSNLLGTLTLSNLPFAFLTNNAPSVTFGALDVADGKITYGGYTLMLATNSNYFAGLDAGNLTLTGAANTGVGAGALTSDAAGSDNTAFGVSTLYFNNSGSNNAAYGFNSLLNNTSGNNNIALGALAGFSVISNDNIDIGNQGTTNDNGIIRIGDPALQTDAYIAGIIHGDGSGLTNLNIILPANVVTTNESSVTLNALTLDGVVTANNGINVVGGNLDLSSSEVTSGGNSIFDSDGNDNLFVGWQAGNVGNDSGNDNVAAGYQALYSNTTGNNNIANGFEALYSNTNGYDNTANGVWALYYNANGYENTANGIGALYSNTTGNYNTANGAAALYFNTTGVQNTANGNGALYSNTTGNFNVADGEEALVYLTNGDQNIALGYLAGGNLNNGSNNIDIGNQGVDGENGIIRIGDTNNQTDTYLAGNVWASGNVTAYSVNVTSDRNAKEDFAAVNPQQVLAKVAAMPVTEWNYKTAKNVEHIGPMAQDFQAAFGLNGKDDKHISVVDEGGVALAAIQGLNQKLNDKDAQIQKQNTEIQNLKQQNDSFEKQLSELKALVSQLSQQQTK